MKEIIRKLANFEDLTTQEMTETIEEIAQGQVSESQIAALLLGLKMKGESLTERMALAKVMQSHSISIPTQVTDAMDNCGTGGDRSFSFNVSTTSSFILAGGGIHVAKHGNRSISSKSGSADVLEALGINLDLSAERLGDVFDRLGIVFLFAKNLHPAMKYIMPARLALGIPTIMNMTGPLINPVPLKTQLMGISRPELLTSTAQVLGGLGRKRALVVTGPDGMDEGALHGTTHFALYENNQVQLGSFTPEEVGLPYYNLSDIQGGDAQENAEILVQVLKGKEGACLDTTLLNAGLGFYANGKVASIQEGINLAREVVVSGAAYEKLRQLQENQK